jgi:hypothetical protein
MKNSQVYFIPQCQIQNFDYYPTEGSHEFPSRNQMFLSLFFCEQWKVKYLQTTIIQNMNTVNGIK